MGIQIIHSIVSKIKSIIIKTVYSIIISLGVFLWRKK